MLNKLSKEENILLILLYGKTQAGSNINDVRAYLEHRFGASQVKKMLKIIRQLGSTDIMYHISDYMIRMTERNKSAVKNITQELKRILSTGDRYSRYEMDYLRHIQLITTA